MLCQLLGWDGTQVGVDDVVVGPFGDGGEEVVVQGGDGFLIVVEVVGRTTAGSHEVGIAVGAFGQGFLGLHVVHILPDLVGGNILVEVAVGQEQHFAQIVEGEVTAGTGDGILAAAVAINYTLNTLCGDGVGIVHHFNKDKLTITAVSLVHVQYSVGCRTRTRKRI